MPTNALTPAEVQALTRWRYALMAGHYGEPFSRVVSHRLVFLRLLVEQGTLVPRAWREQAA